MTAPEFNVRRLFVATLVMVAAVGWGVAAYSAHAFATRDEERQAALTLATTERNELIAERAPLLGEQARLVGAQQRLQAELTLAKAQLSLAQEQPAVLRTEQKEPNAVGRRKPHKPSGATGRSELTKLIESAQ